MNHLRLKLLLNGARQSEANTGDEMTTTFQNLSGLGALSGLKVVFPHADATIVSALATQEMPLMTYLAEAHELTRSEVAEALEAFFNGTNAENQLSA